MSSLVVLSSKAFMQILFLSIEYIVFLYLLVSCFLKDIFFKVFLHFYGHLQLYYRADIFTLFRNISINLVVTLSTSLRVLYALAHTNVIPA